MDPLIVDAMREQLYRADVARAMPGYRYIALAEWATNYGISLLDRIDAQTERIKTLEAEVDTQAECINTLENKIHGMVPGYMLNDADKRIDSLLKIIDGMSR